MLIEAIHRHLELARQGLLTTRRFPTWLDDKRREARMLEIFEAEEATLGAEPADTAFEDKIGPWNRDYTRALVERLIAGLSAASLLFGEPQKDDAMLDQAVRRVLFRDDRSAPNEAWLTGIRGKRLMDCAREAKFGTDAEREVMEGFAVPRYADELRLVRTAGGEVALRPAGEVLLGLRGRDAMRWLLALEVSSALGDQDRWRISVARAKGFADERYTRTVEDGDPSPWPWDYPTTRLELAGMVEVKRPDGDHDGAFLWLCRVTPVGAELFGELERPSGEALRSFARSVLADEAHVALHGRPPIVTEVSRLGRHTKMVAHELRNALVPVQYALKQLRRQLAGEGMAVGSVGALDTIAGGIERALRFVVDTARMTSHGAAHEELFGVLATLRDAIGSVQPELKHLIELHAPEDVERIYLRGWREHLVLAFLNLLRNAVQAGGEEVRIFVTSEATARVRGRLLTVRVEDDGPGIPSEQQSEIFTDGVSLRAGGTGHGLALVREVIEEEFRGSVDYERSPRGGARFIVQLPIPLEGQA